MIVANLVQHTIGERRERGHDLRRPTARIPSRARPKIALARKLVEHVARAEAASQAAE